MTTWFDDQTPKRRRQPLLHTFSLVSGKNEAVFFFFSFFFARPRGRRWMRSDVPKQPAESRKMATYLPTFLFFIHSMNVRGKKITFRDLPRNELSPRFRQCHPAWRVAKISRPHWSVMTSPLFFFVCLCVPPMRGRRCCSSDHVVPNLVLD